VIDPLESRWRDVNQDLVVGALTELVGKDREVVEEAVPARVHDRQVGRIVLDRPQAGPTARSDQKVRSARVLGRLVAQITRVKLNALVR